MMADVPPDQDSSNDSTEEEDSKGNNGAARGPRDDIKVSVISYQKTGSGNEYTYDVEVEVNGRAKLLHRNYHDLLWLHRNLTRMVDIGGYVLPPMPALPPKSLNPKTQILGGNSRALYGDHSRIPCMAIEVFLQSLADHRFFAENHIVHTYLTSDDVPAHDQLGPGSLWYQISKAFTDYQMGRVQFRGPEQVKDFIPVFLFNDELDTDEDMARFYKYIDSTSPLLLTTTQDFFQLVSSWQSLACSVVALTEALKQLAGWETVRGSECASLLEKMSGGLEEDKIHMYAASMDAKHSLGFSLDLNHGFCLQGKEMLYRRLMKLNALLSCIRDIDRATKPEKKEAAESAKVEAEKSFNLINETAREEMELFREQQVRSLRSGLISYTESQVAHSKRTLENLSHLRDELAGVTLGEWS